jgi:hypothetical protein
MGNTNDSWFNSDFGKLITNVGTTFINTTLERNGLIKPGPQPSGNLSEAQIKAGQTAGTPTIKNSNPNADGLLNSLGFGMNNGGINWMMIGIVAALVLVLVLIFRK